MSDISQWSPIAANNNAAPPDGAPEGMPASAVNDTMRENMAALRRHAEDGGWFDWGDSYTYVSADTFQVAGDRSSTYTVGRRVRIVQTATVYGTIADVTVSANTDVTVAVDGGGSIVNEAMAVSVGLEAGVLQQGAYTGEVRMFGYALSDAAWLLCDGSAVSRATYAALFAVLGTTHGAGDGSTTFNLPDLQGRSPMGTGTGDTAEGGGTGTARSLADKVGAETHKLTGAESGVGEHTHTIARNFSTNAGGSGGPIGTLDSGSEPTSGVVGGAQPASQGHNNMSPVYVLRFYIRI